MINAGSGLRVENEWIILFRVICVGYADTNVRNELNRVRVKSYKSREISRVYSYSTRLGRTLILAINY